MTVPSPWAAAAVAHIDRLCSGGPIDRSLRITLNFHPDRGTGGGSVLEAMAREGVYRSQFETGTSNGGLTAYPGGDRWQWEQRIFGGAYDGAPAPERPKYGALNHRRRDVGGAIRFGSAHLRLAEHTLDRSTFCFPDSVLEPDCFATAHRFDLLDFTAAFDAVERDDALEAQAGGLLDDYIEAHIHGQVSLAEDVEAVVLDPSYRHSETEAIALGLGVPVEWHGGRVLQVTELERHPRFRGPAAIEAGSQLAEGGTVNARILGDAARRAVVDPQELKHVWHLVARFGMPASSTPHAPASAS